MAKRVKRKDPFRYVIGYSKACGAVYGPDYEGHMQYCRRMSLFTAKHRLKGLRSIDAMRVIYKLVPVFVLQPGQVVGKKKGRKAR